MLMTDCKHNPDAKGPEEFPHALVVGNEIIAWVRDAGRADAISRCCRDHEMMKRRITEQQEAIEGLEKRCDYLRGALRSLERPLSDMNNRYSEARRLGEQM